MSHIVFQCFCLRTMRNGQINVDGRYPDIGHDAVAVDIQNIVIGVHFLIVQAFTDALGQQRIIFLRLLPCFPDGFIIQLLHGFKICCFYQTPVPVTEEIAHYGIDSDPQRKEKEEYCGQNSFPVVLHIVASKRGGFSPPPQIIYMDFFFRLSLTRRNAAAPMARTPHTVNIHVPQEPVLGSSKPLVLTTVKGTAP